MDTLEPILCHCPLATTASNGFDCCKYCKNHKPWLLQDDYTYDRYKLEAMIEENEERRQNERSH